MARYVFTMCVKGNCIVYDESTPEEDKMDARFTEMGGPGYLSFWKRCKEATIEFRRLINAVNGMKYLGTVLPGTEWLTDVDLSTLTATISDLDYGEEREL